VQRFRCGLVFKAHRLCVSLNSRLESNEEEEGATGQGWLARKAKRGGAAWSLGMPVSKGTGSRHWIRAYLGQKGEVVEVLAVNHPAQLRRTHLVGHVVASVLVESYRLPRENSEGGEQAASARGGQMESGVGGLERQAEGRSLEKRERPTSGAATAILLAATSELVASGS